VTDVGDLRKAGEAKKWTLLISLIHTCRTATRDEGQGTPGGAA